MKEYGDMRVEFNDCKLTIKSYSSDIGIALSSDLFQIFKKENLSRLFGFPDGYLRFPQKNHVTLF